MQVKYPIPRFTNEQAAAICAEHFGIHGALEFLPSERDQNFYVKSEGGDFVLKISNVLENYQTLDLQNAAMQRLSERAPELKISHVRRSLAGDFIITVDSERGRHFVRLLTYVPGRILARINPVTSRTRLSLGQVLGRIDRAFEHFEHPAAKRELKWDVMRLLWIREYLQYVKDSKMREMLVRVLADFEANQNLLRLRSSIIYNDANDHNVLVTQNGNEVIGVIDFGDMVFTRTICELAVGIPYAIFGDPDPLTASCEVVRGYHEIFPLQEEELEVLFLLIKARLCISVVNAAYQREAEPGNAYLTVTEEAAWKLLQQLQAINADLAHFRFRHACGLQASPNVSAIHDCLKKNAGMFGPLLSDSRATVVDLGVGTSDFGTLGDICDRKKLELLIFDRIRARGAKIGIGRYNEPRVLSLDEAVVRTIHLGLDLFAQPGTIVLAPLEGVVHSFRNNAARLDYGPTIILQHSINGIRFYTLYGHLSVDSLEDLRAGEQIARGSVVGRIGAAPDNGDWPPHLHFQIITELMGMEGDYPGNCAPEQRDFWTQLCPDPNLIASFSVPDLSPPQISKEEVSRLRSKYLSGALSVSYHNPLHIVRGWKQFLFDATGRRFLDAVNNVAHVGHCHPRVVSAAQRQIALLNTNTRYLHENLSLYAQRLASLFPPSLQICFFVNSGSEANELAVRLARTYTKAKDMIVLEGGYHGNTSTLIDLSSYKFDGRGGFGAADWVHKVPLADTFRGIFRKEDADAAQKYADFILHATKRIAEKGRKLCGLLHETMPSTAGQIVFPAGYLEKVYRYIRDAGGVCIADEVQTGFGRLGSHFWGFETQGVVPDIVTLGKPIGNGHPLGVVLTSPKIAEAFLNGMEFFSTFGGNPVSCVVGMAVLDVIEEEQLQKNALQVGSFLLQGLSDLKNQYPLIGDVRGMGLYLGVELVSNAERIPAAAQASYIVNRMREQGVLISTDGIDHNVLKIRPPLVFQQSDAEFLLSRLSQVLKEDAAAF